MARLLLTLCLTRGFRCACADVMMPAPTGWDAMADLVLLAAFASRPEALIVQALLRAEGIDALAPDANVLLTELDPTFTTGWRLLVREDDLAQALAILRDAQLAPGEA